MTGLEAIERCGVVAVLRGRGPDYLVATAEALVQAGVEAVEISLTTPGALDAIQELRDRLPKSAMIGAGTVLEPEQVDAAHRHGAQFLIAPSTDVDVIRRARERDVPLIPGALTPSEVSTALRAGAPAIKLFPAASVGVDYLRALRGPFPDVDVIPTGGIDAELARRFVAAGAVAVGIGTPVVGDALRGGDLAALADRASAFLDMVARGRAEA